MKTSHAKISPEMRKLSAYIAGAIRKPLPRDVTERAKVHLVDTFAAIISGSRLAPGRKAVAYVKASGGKPEACVFGTSIVSSSLNAALANGMLAHADETDDTHPPSRTHPGVCAVPAAFAIGERSGLPGTTVLRAIVLGYDICARVALALRSHGAFRQSGHHAGSFGGIFGAAAAAGALLRLDAREVRYMLSYAAQQAAGLYSLLRPAEHTEKAFAAAGMAAHNGVAAALMVTHGFIGADDVFSGERAFFSTFEPKADRGHLARGLGRDYEILRCAIKWWPVGAPNLAPLNVLQELMRLHKFKASDVKNLVVRIPDKFLDTVDDREMPDICIQHLLAVMLLDGAVTFESAHDHARMKNPRVLAMRKRIAAIGDPALTDGQRRWRCVMEIKLQDGRSLKRQTLAAKGAAANPLTREEVEDKAYGLITPVLGERRARALMKALWDFDRIGNVRSLRKLVSA